MESAKEKWGWLPKSKITGDAVSPKEKRLGYLVGRYVYLIDALDDLEEEPAAEAEETPLDAEPETPSAPEGEDLPVEETEEV